MLEGKSKKVLNCIEPINLKDDYFITCSSFEDRTTTVTEKLSESYKMEKAIIFKYTDKTRSNTRDLNHAKVLEILSKHTANTYTILCDRLRPLDGIQRLKNHLKQTNMELNQKLVTIDMTTFTKQYLLVLLKYIEKQDPKSLRLFYTEPEKYALSWKKPLSYGIIDLVSVPTYGGHYDIDKENLLVFLLGYEGDRAYRIWERFAPNKTIALIGKPSFRSSWEGRVEAFNKKLIEKLDESCIDYISSLDPFEVSKKLDTVLLENIGYNVIIAPLGPKPQVIGCHIALRNHPDVQIIYAIPKYYEEKYFTKKGGNIWEYL